MAGIYAVCPSCGHQAAVEFQYLPIMKNYTGWRLESNKELFERCPVYGAAFAKDDWRSMPVTFH